MSKGKTSIQISHDTAYYLHGLKRWTETYDEVIRRLTQLGDHSVEYVSVPKTLLSSVIYELDEVHQDCEEGSCDDVHELIDQLTKLPSFKHTTRWDITDQGVANLLVDGRPVLEMKEGSHMEMKHGVVTASGVTFKVI